MPGKVTKTNVARLLDKAKINYELISYPVDESDLSAQHIAETVGEDINKVFKTIVLKGDRNGHFICVVPGNCEVDLKLAAKASGNKKADLILMKELLPLTGYIRGGCSPIGLKKPFPIFYHSSITLYDKIYVSAGQRGTQLLIAPSELIAYTNGTITDLVDNSK